MVTFFSVVIENVAAWSLVQPVNGGITRREEHSSVIDSSGNIYVIAGVEGNTTRHKLLSDIWRLNTGTSKLSSVDCHLHILRYHFADQFMRSLTDTWTQLANPPAGFGQRFLHASVFDSVTNSIYTTGGATASGDMSDMWSYEISLGTYCFLPENIKTLLIVIIMLCNVIGTWVLVGMSGQFSPRESHSFVMDSATGFGYVVAGAFYPGVDDFYDSIYGDVWSINFRGLCIVDYFLFTHILHLYRWLMICVFLFTIFHRTFVSSDHDSVGRANIPHGCALFLFAVDFAYFCPDCPSVDL